MMKLLIAAFLGLYLAFAVWAHATGGVDLGALLASGPVAVAAFAVGYAIDLLIFGFFARSVVKWRRQRRASNAPSA